MNTSATFLGYQEAEKIYEQVKYSGITKAGWGLAVAIAFIIIITESIKAYQKAYDKDIGRPDAKDFILSITPLIYYSAIIIGLPLIIQTIEQLFGALETAIFKKIPIQPENIWSGLKSEVKHLHENRSGIFEIAAVFDDLLIGIIKPTVTIIDQWLYMIMLCGRFIYLLLLEIVAPIAIVTLLSKKTASIFQIWSKNMLICYLLVPAFMLAHAFAQAVSKYFVASGNAATYVLIAMLFVKFQLYKIAAHRVFNLI